MRLVRKTAHAALAALVLAASLSGPHPAWAQRPAPPLVVDEMRRVHADFATGGTGRLNINWTNCVKRATASGDADTAERCLVYTFGALLLDDSDTSHRGLPPMSSMTPDNVAAAQSRLLEIMGVPPNGRRASLDQYKKWAFQQHMADVRDGTPRGGWNGVLSDMGRPTQTPTRPYAPGQATIDPSTLFPSPSSPSSPSMKNPVTPKLNLPFSQPGERPPVEARPAPVAPPPPSGGRIAPPGEASEIPLQKRGGTFSVPVLLNNTVSVKFTIDSGASDVSISQDVFDMLKRSGTLDRTDLIGKQTYRLADGSRVTNDTFRIRVLRVGDKEVRDVIGSVSNGDGSLLLGQSFLTRFQSWSIDNQRQVLVLR